jgi:hypothetical protein
MNPVGYTHWDGQTFIIFSIIRPDDTSHAVGLFPAYCRAYLIDGEEYPSSQKEIYIKNNIDVDPLGKLFGLPTNPYHAAFIMLFEFDERIEM